MIKDSTLAVVSLRHRIARRSLQSLAGLVAVAAVGYSAVLAKEARTLPALASIEMVAADPSATNESGSDAADITRVSGPAVPGSASDSLPASLPSNPRLDPEVNADGALNKQASPVVVSDPFAKDPSVRWFDGRPIKPVRTVWMTVTGYSADARSCGESADGLTATLHSVYTNGSRLVAADPSVLDYGSMLTVPGYDSGLVVPVLDCGGAIKGRRLDLLFPTHEQARQWGVQRLLVTVWGYADGRPAENPRKMR